MISVTESEQRIKFMQARLREEFIDGALFVYPVDLFYFTGTRQNGALWIPANSPPILLVRKSLTRARNESLIPDTRPFPSSKEFPFLFDKNIQRIGLTLDVLPVQYYQYYTGLLEGRDFLDISNINRELRSIKSQEERESLRQSGRIFSDIFKQVPGIFRPGMREVDLAAEFEYLLRKSGNASSVRMRAFGQDIIGLAVAGASAAEPGCFDGPVIGRGILNNAPFGSSTDIIKRNTPILIDYPGIFSGYIVDMTRIFVLGELDSMLAAAFDVALKVQDWVVANLRPGVICEDLHLGALRIAEESGFGANFMGIPGEQAKFIGHGVGLELDELPVLARGFKTLLQEGHVVAIEPKFVFPGKGSVGIENTWLVTAAQSEKLTDLSDEIVYL
jgi:Xaa-Pro aminopeptidase